MQLESKSAPVAAPAAPVAAPPERVRAAGPTAALQRTVGNRATAAAIADSGIRGAGAPLPHLAAIQRSFGRHSLARARAHLDAAAVSSVQRLNAHAFTHGEHVAFAGQPSLHTAAHEAAHVIQQRAGVHFAGGVGRAGDPFERQADAVADRVVHGLSSEALLDRITPSGRGQSAQPVVQRLERGQRPFESGYESLLTDPLWLPTAEAYEKRLGVYAYTHPLATAALTAALNKMLAVMRAHYNTSRMKSTDRRTFYREVFTRDYESSAGQVGDQLTSLAIIDMLSTGNLRERMTAFYNAAYFNNDGRFNPATWLRGFKQIVGDIILNNNIQAATDLDLDVPTLTAMSEFYRTSWWRWGAYNLSKMLAPSKAYNFNDDPFAVGNLTLEKEFRGVLGTGLGQWGRLNRPALAMPAEQRSLNQYLAISPTLNLSARERSYLMAKTGASALAFPNTKLPWKEGHTLFQMSPDNWWVKKIRDQLHMPVVGGISGTTTRMLNAYKWLNVAAPAINFRLALMGWMLPAWDHSLYEIMRGSHLAGVKGPGEGDLDDVVRMYMNVPPLTTPELRAHVAVNRQFPQEIVYAARFNPGPNQHTAFDDTNNWAAVSGNVGFENLSEAHATAIYGYTTGVHPLLNAVMVAPRGTVAMTVRSKLTAYLWNKLRLRWLNTRLLRTPAQNQEHAKLSAEQHEELEVVAEPLAGWLPTIDAATTQLEFSELWDFDVQEWLDDNLSRIIAELRTHANITVEGLAVLPSVTGITVYRGDWAPVFLSQIRQGAVVRLDTFTSFSEHRATSIGFMTSGTFSYKTLMELQLTGLGGKDIRDLSRYPEDEVLMVPGTRIRIDNIVWDNTMIPGEWVKRVQATEV